MQTETCIFPLPLEIMAWFKCSVVFTYLFQICAVWVHLMSSALALYAHRADGPASSVQRERREMN